jgi:aquaporin Z
VNPARSIGPALFVGGWAISQLWLFIIAPLIGAVLASGVYMMIREPEALITSRQAEQALESQQAERNLRQGRNN